METNQLNQNQTETYSPQEQQSQPQAMQSEQSQPQAQSQTQQAPQSYPDLDRRLEEVKTQAETSALEKIKTQLAQTFGFGPKAEEKKKAAMLEHLQKIGRAPTLQDLPDAINMQVEEVLRQREAKKAQEDADAKAKADAEKAKADAEKEAKIDAEISSFRAHLIKDGFLSAPPVAGDENSKKYSELLSRAGAHFKQAEEKGLPPMTLMQYYHYVYKNDRVANGDAPFAPRVGFGGLKGKVGPKELNTLTYEQLAQIGE